MNKSNDSHAGFEFIDFANMGQPSGTEIKIVIHDDYQFVIYKRIFDKKYTLF